MCAALASVRGNREPAATPLRAALQIPFPQTKKSAQKIVGGVGTISETLRDLFGGRDAETLDERIGMEGDQV
jgi:hypothetical protein